MTLAGKKKPSKFAWCLAILVAWFILSGPVSVFYAKWATQGKVLEFAGSTMGTRYSMKCWSYDPDAYLAIGHPDIEKILADINQQMSTYLPDSELSRFNAAPVDEWFEVSSSTAYVTQRALHYNQITDGCSDVTVGPLVELWNFGPGRETRGSKLASPPAALLASARAKTGGESLQVRLEPPALRKEKAHLSIDLSSIAKGYAVDVIAEHLLARGFANFMVEIGGEVRAGGSRLDGQPWRIALEAPDPNQRALHAVVQLDNRALATSGDYRNFREFAGEKVSHIIDPKTGRPLLYRGWSVTLLTPTCLEADALATALLVMGEQRGYDWCVEQKIAALFLMREGDEIVEKATPDFPKLQRLPSTASQGK